MRAFTDAAGRTWTIALNLGTALAVKDSLGVDLLQPEMPYTGNLPAEASAKEAPPLLTRLGTDELLLGEVLCAMLAEQFEAHKVTTDDVRAGLDSANELAQIRLGGSYGDIKVQHVYRAGRQVRSQEGRPRPSEGLLVLYVGLVLRGACDGRDAHLDGY